MVLLTWTPRGSGTHISVPSLFPPSHPSLLLKLFRLSATTLMARLHLCHRYSGRRPSPPTQPHHPPSFAHGHRAHSCPSPRRTAPLRPFWRRPRRVYWVRAATPVPGVLGGRRGLGEAAGPMTTLTSGRAIVAPPVQSVAADGKQGRQGPMAAPSAGPVGD